MWVDVMLLCQSAALLWWLTAVRQALPPLCALVWVQPSTQNLHKTVLCKFGPIFTCHVHLGGKSEDFAAAAKLFHAAGERVKVPTYLVPATQKVWADVYSVPVPGCDGKTAAQIFEEVRLLGVSARGFLGAVLPPSARQSICVAAAPTAPQLRTNACATGHSVQISFNSTSDSRSC